MRRCVEKLKKLDEMFQEIFDTNHSLLEQLEIITLNYYDKKLGLYFEEVDWFDSKIKGVETSAIEDWSVYMSFLMEELHAIIEDAVDRIYQYGIYEDEVVCENRRMKEYYYIKRKALHIISIQRNINYDWM